VRVQFPPGAL